MVDRGDCVVVDILSVSRGRGLGRLIYPLIGPMQRRFFRAQLDVVEAACSSPPPPELTPPGAATYGGVRPRVVGLPSSKQRNLLNKVTHHSDVTISTRPYLRTLTMFLCVDSSALNNAQPMKTPSCANASSQS